jgi:segregation and condensation protein A
MDLLLYLVRREEVDIYDIPIAEITDQYIRYIEMLKSLDIDLAGDFLVMASTLLQIKSAMLLPKVDDEALGSEELVDPRAELIRQLLEYKKFKDAANLLSAAAEETNKRFIRPGTIIEQLKPGGEPEVDIEQLSVWDLLEVFSSIVEATGGARFDVSHITDDTPIDLYQVEILHRLQAQGTTSFARIFEGKTQRIVMIGLFLATLELIREKLVAAEQQGSSIYLRALTEENAEEAVQKAIFALTEAAAEQTVQAKPPETPPPIPIEEIPPGGLQKAPAAYEEVKSADKPPASSEVSPLSGGQAEN